MYHSTYRCTDHTRFGGVIHLQDLQRDIGRRPPFLTSLTQPEPLGHVLLATRFNNHFERADENTLLYNLWESPLRNFLLNSLKPCRFLGTQESAWNIVDTLLALEPIDLKLFLTDLERVNRILGFRSEAGKLGLELKSDSEEGEPETGKLGFWRKFSSSMKANVRGALKAARAAPLALVRF